MEMAMGMETAMGMILPLAGPEYEAVMADYLAKELGLRSGDVADAKGDDQGDDAKGGRQGQGQGAGRGGRHGRHAVVACAAQEQEARGEACAGAVRARARPRRRGLPGVHSSTW